jgi:hypothetical protein
MVEITGGIAAGDTVVSAGQLKLRDGSPVAIAGAGAGKPAGTTAAGATPGGANAGAPVKGAAMAAPAKADGATAGAAPRS